MEIKFENVSYKEKLKDISFNIKSGKIVGIISKNDDIKKSFLDLIYGLIDDYEGKILINNGGNKKSINYYENKFYLKEELYNELFSCKVIEDIKISLTDLDMEKLIDVLISFKISKNILEKNYCELSLGEIKKILISIMFASDKKILILDNPTLDLDPKSVDTLIKLLKNEKRKDKIIFIYSSNSDFLLRVIDEVIYLNKKVIHFKNKYEIYENKKLINKINISIPKTLEFRNIVLSNTGIKLLHRDNINDLIKDIYRSV
ncbi:MAG: ATP-binding cassette domain-containing protein [bacterium]|nr:ATP-binding cassette domain-containing protein [bacterium]